MKLKGLYLSIALAFAVGACGGETAQADEVNDTPVMADATQSDMDDTGEDHAAGDDHAAGEDHEAGEDHAADPDAMAAMDPANHDAMNNQEAPSAEMIAAGKELFHGNGICFTCHGPDGTGTAIGPALNDSEWLNIEGEATLEAIVERIAAGVPEPVEFAAPMPAKGGSAISDDDVKAVAAYVWSLSQDS